MANIIRYNIHVFVYMHICLYINVFSSLRLRRRPLLYFSSACWDTSWPSRNRKGESKGSLEVLLRCLWVSFSKKFVRFEGCKGSWVRGRPFAFQEVRESPGRCGEVPERFRGVLEGPLESFIFICLEVKLQTL